MSIERLLTYGLFSDSKFIGDWDLDTLVRKTYKSAEAIHLCKEACIDVL